MARRSSQTTGGTPTDGNAGPVAGVSEVVELEKTDAEIDAHIRLALAQWPQIDPEVEGIVTRIAKAHNMIEREARASLSRGGLTKEEFKVLIALLDGPRSHGALCRRLCVSTGAMTNRLDKLEHAGLLTRLADPDDRRGVLLELTSAGRDKLDESVDAGAHRERQLLAALSSGERHQLDRLLRKLLVSLQSELGDSGSGASDRL